MAAAAQVDEDEFDWEEWDRDKMPFHVHMIAGSFAGVMEHLAMFPVDTVKTHLQSQTRRCPRTSALGAAQRLVAAEGPLRLWRGASSVLVSCIPAHALYFSVYEATKSYVGSNSLEHTPLASASTGIAATVIHDAVMTPLDVCKQRLQLGYYRGLRDCITTVLRTEGPAAFYLSYPTTLAMNVPFAAVMVGVNDTVRKALKPAGDYTLHTFMVSGAVAGACAAGITTPLDVIKTKLQTQLLSPSASCGAPDAARRTCTNASSAASTEGAAAAAAAAATTPPPTPLPAAASGTTRYTGFLQAAQAVYAQEGWRGFLRGIKPRLLFHTPAVAISWTAYETCKDMLMRKRRPCMLHTAVIDLRKEAMKFSPATLRTAAGGGFRLTGANVYLRLAARVAVGENGMGPDYNCLKRAVSACAARWDEKLLLPEQDPNISIEQSAGTVRVLDAANSLLLLSVPDRDTEIIPRTSSASLEALAACMATEVAAASAAALPDAERQRLLGFVLALKSHGEISSAAWPDPTASEIWDLVEPWA